MIGDDRAEKVVAVKTTERGTLRLQMARKLLKLPDDADVLKHINGMSKGAREHLRGLVDWVEEYEKHERKTWVSAQTTGEQNETNGR